MAKRTVILTPKTNRILLTVGEQIKLARLRRKLSAELVSERAGISRATLWAVENGSSTVSFWFLCFGFVRLRIGKRCSSPCKR